MAKSNKRLRKLRHYRDRLMLKVTNLESRVRNATAIMYEIRKALQNENTIRAYALASDKDGSEERYTLRHVPINRVVNELTLTYRILSVERRYTAQMLIAANNRDYLRVAALCVEHLEEAKAHDKMLGEWSQDHGYTRALRKEIENEDGI